MATGTVKALWIGGPGYAVAGGPELVPGETVVEISHGEAETSANWQPLGAPTQKAPSKAELAATAAELGIDVPAGAKKDEIQALLDAHVAEPDTDPPPAATDDGSTD